MSGRCDRRLRTTLQEATHTIDRVLLATRITAGSARDAAEHYKNELRGSPAALRIEPAPHFFAPAAALAAAALGSQFFYVIPVRRAGERPSGRGHALLRSLRPSPSAYRSRLGAPRKVSCERASYRMAGTAAVVAGL